MAMRGCRSRPARRRIGAAGIALAITLLAATGCASDVTERAASTTAPPSTAEPGSSTSPAPASTAAASTSAPTTSAPTTSAAPATTGTEPTSTTAPAARPLTGRIIVIDPGHNGANARHSQEIGRSVDAGGFQKACNTTGTADGNLTESAFTWALAQEVRTRLEATGATVLLTRNSDDGWGPCVDERGQIAARAGADALVSLHADGAAPSAQGFHVIHPSPRTGYVSPATAAASADLATAVRDRLIEAGLSPADYIGDRRGLDERDDLGTLNRAETPAVLLEAGNMHHPATLAQLQDPTWRAPVADALTKALIDRFG